MDWLRRLLARIFGWYVPSAYGRQDGERRSYPAAGVWQTLDNPLGDLEVVEATLVGMLDEEASNAGADRLGIQMSNPKRDDVARAIINFKELLARRGLNTERLHRQHWAELIHVLRDCVAAQRARAEGRDPAPSSQGLIDFEVKLIEEADKQTAELFKRYEASYQATEARLKSLKERFKSLSKEHATEIATHRKKEFKQPHIMLPKWLYFPLMLVLAGLEFPFNMVAFQILGEESWLTAAMALAPSLVIPWLAHVLGTKVRQWPPKSPRRLRIVLVVAITLVALLVGLGSLAALRTAWVAEITKSMPDVLQVTALIGINFLFLAMGTVAAYFAHDPDMELERVTADLKTTRKKLREIWLQWIAAMGRLDALRGILRAQISRVRWETLARINEYRYYNTRYRDGGWPEEAWHTAPTMRLFAPLALPELDLPPPPEDAAFGVEGDDVEQLLIPQSAEMSPASIPVGDPVAAPVRGQG